MENTEMTYEQRHAKEYEKVSLREQICYGLGDSACNVVYGLCSTLLTFFYTDYVGVNPLTVGMVFLITRVFDGVWDLLQTVQNPNGEKQDHGFCGCLCPTQSHLYCCS